MQVYEWKECITASSFVNLILIGSFSFHSFDLYFRKNPFGGEFTVFAGLEECIKFIANFKFTEHDISFLQSVMPMCEVSSHPYMSNLSLFPWFWWMVPR